MSVRLYEYVIKLNEILLYTHTISLVVKNLPGKVEKINIKSNA